MPESSVWGSSFGKEIHNVHIFLAGNSSRSAILTEPFAACYEKHMQEIFKKTYPGTTDDFFCLHPALGSPLPNATAKKENPISGIEAVFKKQQAANKPQASIE